MSALLQIENVTAGYGANQVLRGLSLEVAEGGLTAIIGPNGHGKTTLLRTISGLVALRGGSITFAGAALANKRPDEIVAAGIVHVPQGDLLFPEYGPHHYRPASGAAILFACGLLHEALPVTRGRRFTLLSFLRDPAPRDPSSAPLRS